MVFNVTGFESRNFSIVDLSDKFSFPVTYIAGTCTGSSEGRIDSGIGGEGATLFSRRRNFMTDGEQLAGGSSLACSLTATVGIIVGTSALA